MSQSDQFHETWAHLRDHARPVVPDDVFFLRELRADQPPSRAHVKRVTAKSARPNVSTAHPRPPRAPDPVRLRHNEACAYGARIAALVGYVKPIVR